MGSVDLMLLGGLLLFSFSVYSIVSTLLANNTDKDLLSWASGNEPVKSKSPLVNSSRPLVHNFTLQHAIKIKNKKYRTSVDTLLVNAGLKSELNVDEFIGLQILWGVMAPVLLAIMNFTLGLGLPWVLVFAAAVGGMYLPHGYAKGEREKRYNSARKDLPFFADLLALSTEAGLDFIGSIKRIVEKAPEDNVLAGELGVVLNDISLGATRADALRGLAKRLDTNEVMSFVAVLVDADATGASISKVLKDQSVQIRLERFVRAEKAGAKASQAILFPMILFIFPAVFLVVLGPVALQFFGGK